MKNSENEIRYSEFEQEPTRDWVFSYRHKNRLERLVEDVRHLRAQLRISREIVRALLDADNNRVLKEKRKRAKK